MMQAVKSRISPGLILLAVAVVALLAGRQWLLSLYDGSLDEQQHGLAPERAISATLFREPGPMPGFTLIDHHGQPFTRDDLSGHWTFMVFGYTHCPDVCPTVLAALNEVSHLLQQRDDIEQPRVVFVSLDPGRDSVARLADFIPGFNPGFLGAGGSEQQIEALTRQLGILSQQQKAAAGDGGYLIDHTSAIFLIDPRGLLRALNSPPHDPLVIASDYRRITAMAIGIADATWPPAPR
ncbi:MAG TPA: SCO family protein [Gammaproteobacteria bacterium]|nr:SCO family protein [Gammaproteobacteria bacterium]